MFLIIGYNYRLKLQKCVTDQTPIFLVSETSKLYLMKLQNHYRMELDTVISSDLFSQDEYIKRYLLDPDLSLISKIKIGLRYYITAQPELILQLTVFKGCLKEINPFLYIEIFGKDRNDSKKRAV